MIRPKYKEMYKEIQREYNGLLYWVRYMLNTLKEQKLIDYTVEYDTDFFTDTILFEVLGERHFYLAAEIWNDDLTKMLKGVDKE